MCISGFRLTLFPCNLTAGAAATRAYFTSILVYLLSCAFLAEHSIRKGSIGLLLGYEAMIPE